MYRETSRRLDVVVRIGIRVLIAVTVISVLAFGLHSLLAWPRSDVLSVIGYGAIAVSALLIAYEIKATIAFQQRRAATDFIFGEVTRTLYPLQAELRDLLGKQHLLFSDGESLAETLEDPSLTSGKKQRIERAVGDILDFYERMSAAILRGSLDEGLCYEDQGLMLLHIVNWAESYVSQYRQQVHNQGYVNVVGLARRWSGKSERSPLILIEKAVQYEKQLTKGRDTS